MPKPFENYFIAGNPVTGDNFFGRTQILERILYSRNPQIFIGLRRIGKTSLLRKVYEKINTGNNLVVLLQGVFSSKTDEFVRSFSESLVYSIETKNKAVQEKVKKEKAGLESLERQEKIRPTELTKILRSLNDKGFKVYLLIDEIDSILQFKDEAVITAGFIRSLASQEIFQTVCTTFIEPTAVQITSPGSAWYNIFSIDYLGLFTDSEAVEMLTTLSQKSGDRLTEGECNFLMEIFGNFPFYLQSAGLYLMNDNDFRSSNQNTRKQAFIKVVPQAVYSLNNFHINYLLNHLEAESLSLLKRISQGKKPSSAKDERLYWKLSKLGLIVESDEKTSLSSLILRESVNSIQEKELLDWDKVREFTLKTIETVTMEAMKVAINKYL